MTKIFIENDWQEYDYSILYNTRGYTNTPSKDIVVYNDSFVQLEAWYNSGYNWIDQDHRWYPVNSTPYYVKTDTYKSLYYIDTRKNYSVYYYDGEYLILSEGVFTTPQILHDTQGITETPSTVWDIDEGEPWSWYNPEENQYWNNKIKEWVDTPPVPGQDEGEPEVLPNPKPLVLIDQFSDIEDPLVVAGLNNFRFAYEYKTWTFGQLFELVNTDIADPLQAYVDVTETGLSLYVIDEDGVTLQGVFYSYGSIINPIEKMTVWVEPEGTQVFYKGETLNTFSYLYDSLSAVTKHFWSYEDNRYYTSDELHEQGYSDTIAHPTSFKSTSLWGIEVGTGYVEGSLTDLINGNYYVDGSGVWVDINTLALSKGLYPTNALDITLYKDLDTSRAAVLRDSGQSYYLVQEDLSYGWITRQEMEALGWDSSNPDLRTNDAWAVYTG